MSNQTKTDHPLVDLIEQYRNEEGDPLIRDSHDWVQIDAALTEWATHVPIPPDVQEGAREWFRMLRLVIQMAYILGYRRGKREATMPEFVVAEEAER